MNIQQHLFNNFTWTELGQLSQLTHLNVSHNVLVELPVELLECRRLKFIFGVNKVTL